ncbi:MAG: EamA family transporter [Spirochaetia bacterium]|nr:EamA family transporter [Spirochaetia bacterium]
MSLTILVLALFSGALNSIWNFFIKKNAADYSVMITGVCVANLSIFPITVLIMATRGFDPHVIPFLLATGVVEAVDFYVLTILYKASDISMAYPVSRGTGLMLTAVFSALILKEAISGMAILGIIAVLLGVFFFALNKGTNPRLIWESLKAQKLALIKGFTIVGYTLVDRVGAKYANPLVYFNFKEIVAMTLLIPILAHGGTLTFTHMKETMRKDGKAALAIGFGIICSYVLVLIIYNMFAEAKASYVTVIRESSVVFGALLGFIVLHEKATPNKIAGILTIILGVILIKVG